MGTREDRGVTILKFLRDPLKRNHLKDALSRVKFVTAAEVEQWYIAAGAQPGSSLVSMDVVARVNRDHPYISRELGAEILTKIISADEVVEVTDSREFVRDSLFCEWAYVIDYDKGTFEVYRGFNEKPVPEGERFAAVDAPREHVPGGTAYYAIKHVMTYKLDDLPTTRQFTKLEDDAYGEENKDEDANVD